ncbi:poly(ADP-ribose) glycohydrolase [Balamuthia mandrillaris]
MLAENSSGSEESKGRHPKEKLSPYVQLPCCRGLTYQSSQEGEVLPLWDLIVEKVLTAALTTPEQLIAALIAIQHLKTEAHSETMPPSFDGLRLFLKERMSEEERVRFFSSTLPFLQRLALQLPELFPSPIALLVEGVEQTVTLTRLQIASLLANAFFCTFPVQRYEAQQFPYFNFSGNPSEECMSCLYEIVDGEYGSQQSEKLRSILHYFERFKQELESCNGWSTKDGGTNSLGTVTYHRRVIHQQQLPDWQISQTRFTDVEVAAVAGFENKIEDAIGMAHVDFANEFIGGGVLQESAIQEQILMMIHPELLAAMLFTAKLTEWESLVIKGAQRYSNYRGYGPSFTFDGDYVLPAKRSKRDAMGRLDTEVIAIDAVDFRMIENGEHKQQYEIPFLLRDLNKAYAGFSVPEEGIYTATKALKPIATGNWGCGIFKGDPQLKAIIQVIAAAQCGRSIKYFAFEQSQLPSQLHSLLYLLKQKQTAIGDLITLLKTYGENRTSNSESVFEFLAWSLALKDFIVPSPQRAGRDEEDQSYFEPPTLHLASTNESTTSIEAFERKVKEEEEVREVDEHEKEEETKTEARGEDQTKNERESNNTSHHLKKRQRTKATKGTFIPQIMDELDTAGERRIEREAEKEREVLREIELEQEQEQERRKLERERRLQQQQQLSAMRGQKQTGFSLTRRMSLSLKSPRKVNLNSNNNQKQKRIEIFMPDTEDKEQETPSSCEMEAFHKEESSPSPSPSSPGSPSASSPSSPSSPSSSSSTPIEATERAIPAVTIEATKTEPQLSSSSSSSSSSSLSSFSVKQTVPSVAWEAANKGALTPIPFSSATVTSPRLGHSKDSALKSSTASVSTSTPNLSASDPGQSFKTSSSDTVPVRKGAELQYQHQQQSYNASNTSTVPVTPTKGKTFFTMAANIYNTYKTIHNEVVQIPTKHSASPSRSAHSSVDYSGSSLNADASEMHSDGSSSSSSSTRPGFWRGSISNRTEHSSADVSHEMEEWSTTSSSNKDGGAEEKESEEFDNGKKEQDEKAELEREWHVVRREKKKGEEIEDQYGESKEERNTEHKEYEGEEEENESVPGATTRMYIEKAIKSFELLTPTTSKRDEASEMEDMVRWEGERDSCGFTYQSKEQYLADKAYSHIIKHNAQQWQAYLRNNKNRLYTTTVAFKNLVRRGIPMNRRRQAWLLCSGARRKMEQNEGYYKSLLRQHETEPSPFAEQIALDAPRTFPGHPYFDEKGQEKLKRILVAYAIRNPTVGYCQSMNFFTGMILLFMKEEEAFWMLVTIMEDILPRHYFGVNLLGVQIDQLVLQDLLSTKLTAVATHLHRNNLSLPLITMQWFSCLFVKDLCPEAVLRVWDCLFNEGNKVLFRVGLAILKMHSAEILKTDDYQSLFVLLKGIPKRLHDYDQLIKVAFDGLGSFPRKKIARLRNHFYPQILEEFNRLQQMRTALSTPTTSSSSTTPTSSSTTIKAETATSSLSSTTTTTSNNNSEKEEDAAESPTSSPRQRRSSSYRYQRRSLTDAASLIMPVTQSSLSDRHESLESLQN